MPRLYQCIDRQDRKEGNSGFEQYIRPDGLDRIYRLFHPKAAEHTFFSSAHTTFIKIYHILDHKQVLIN